MKSIVKFGLICCSILAVMSSCQKDTMRSASEKTGWKYNDPNRGFFSVKTDYERKVPTGMVYVNVTTTVRGQNAEKVSMQENNGKKRATASGFYMDIYEVTNLNWREYVDWMSQIYKYDPIKVVRALPDETVWRRELGYNEPYMQDYYSHPAFNFYPVVGVSWKQAEAYCQWRTDRINELILLKNGIITFTPLSEVAELVRETPDSTHHIVFTTKHAREYVHYQAQNSDYGPNLKYDTDGDDDVSAREWGIALDGVLYDAVCRLPTELEWEYAAYGNPTYDGEYFETHSYPWGGDQVRSFGQKDRKATDGKFYANFMRGRADISGQGMNNTLTVPVNYFMPNAFGLYNMAGNVNEWVMDVYRATNTPVDEINSFRGNKFESDSVYAEDMLVKYFPNLDEYTQAERDSMRRVMIAERGFAKVGGDYRDFKDGDRLSSINDSVLVYKDASPLEKANMISNTARVYKGGSWKDRALWLNPSNRRYLEETKSRSDIGFRCVMSTVGGNEFAY